MKKITYIRPPKDLSRQLRGLYQRVADRVGVDAQYVRQVALGKRESPLVEEALTKEVAKIVEQGTASPSVHQAHFYSEDQVLLDRLIPLIASALKRGDPALVVATKAHQEALEKGLKLEGLDIRVATNEGRYTSIDAIGTLSIFMVNGTPEPARFFRIVGALIEEALKTAKTSQPRLAIFGEWVSVLCAKGQVEAAIRLEQLWGQLAARYEVDLLCGYDMSSMNREAHPLDFKRLCDEHSRICM